MSTPLAVAVAQTVPRRGDVGANLAEHAELARVAARAGARVVLFPELSLTGYELDLAVELAFREEDARLAPLRELAREEEVALVVGAPLALPDGLHLAALVLAPSGAVQIYTKHHLGTLPPSANEGGAVPPPEPSVFVSGNLDPALELGGARAAVRICADLSRAEHTAAAAGRGADLLLASTFVIPADLPGELERLEQAARRHGMAVAFANFGGPTGGLPAAGACTIWSERGERVVRLAPGGRGLALAAREDGRWTGRVLLGEAPWG